MGRVGYKFDLGCFERQITERTFEIGEMDRAMLSGLMELLCCGIPDVMDVVDQVIDGINRFLRGPALLQSDSRTAAIPGSDSGSAADSAWMAEATFGY